MSHYKRHVFAESTKRTYKTHMESYLAFCSAMHYFSVSATSDCLCQYAVILVKSMQYSTVKQYLNIVRLFHLDWGLQNPITNYFQLNCVLQFIRRIKGDTICQKLPITPNLLWKYCLYSICMCLLIPLCGQGV